MADKDKETKTSNSSGWLTRAKAAAKDMFAHAEFSQQEASLAQVGYGFDSVSVSVLLGAGKQAARARQVIYQKLHFMSGDPLVASALRMHCTAALGGNELTGETVFIEPLPEVTKEGVNSARGKLVAELQDDLSEIFNRIAHQVLFNGMAFGDAYARTYVKKGVGLQDVYTDEMVWAPLVQPYERGNETVGYSISTGKKFIERLTIKQMVRLKMPRQGYVPQIRVTQNAMLDFITKDNIDELPIMPSLIGGSFLQNVEESFNYLQTALTGLVGQRILSSIDENLIGANFDGMTIEQRKQFMDSFTKMLKTSKERSTKAIQEGIPVLERIFNIMPMNGEKQLVNISQFQGTSGNQAYNIEDVMLYAKMMAGALGTDLSMIGFADLLSGGLGDGGFFRQSVQAAERSQISRVALANFFNDLVDLHTFFKHGWVFDRKDRPYKINYYGSISALENENAASREKKTNAVALTLQSVGMMKDYGFTKETSEEILSKEMGLDEGLAKMIAVDLEKAAKQAQQEQAGNFGGGGGFGGGDEIPPDDGEQPPPPKDKPKLDTSDDDSGA